MTVGVENKEQVLSAVQKAIAIYGNKKDELIPILTFINHKFGYLPDWALTEISSLIAYSTEPDFLCGKLL